MALTDQTWLCTLDRYDLVAEHHRALFVGPNLDGFFQFALLFDFLINPAGKVPHVNRALTSNNHLHLRLCAKLDQWVGQLELLPSTIDIDTRLF